MLRRITIVMSEQEGQALERLAGAELRHPREHLRFLLFREAKEKGLLTEIPVEPKTESRRGDMQRGQPRLSIVQP